MIIAKDSRGRQIIEGQAVAYNRSGDVIEGTVLDVRPNYVMIAAHPDFMQGRDDTKFSRVKNRRSILVLD